MSSNPNCACGAPATRPTGECDRHYWKRYNDARKLRLREESGRASCPTCDHVLPEGVTVESLLRPEPTPDPRVGPLLDIVRRLEAQLRVTLATIEDVTA